MNQKAKPKLKPTPLDGKEGQKPRLSELGSIAKQDITTRPPGDPYSAWPWELEAYELGFKDGESVRRHDAATQIQLPLVKEKKAKGKKAKRKKAEEKKVEIVRTLQRVPEVNHSQPSDERDKNMGRRAWYLKGFREGRAHNPPAIDRERFQVIYCDRTIVLGNTGSFRFLALLVDRLGKPVNHADLANTIPCRPGDVVDKARRLRNALKKADHADVADAIKARPRAYLLPLHL